MKIITLFVWSLVSVQMNAQSVEQIESLVDVIIIKTDSSQLIAENSNSKIILNYSQKAIPILVEFFSNQEITKIYSDCQKRYLNKGEVAIILADQIESMPYYTVTMIQNCTFSFCENNPNLIEYYFWAIQRDGVNEFTERYLVWLNSDERKK